MKKLAWVLVCVGVLMSAFDQSVEATFGVSGYLVAGFAVLAALALGVCSIVNSKSHAFDQRTTDGGFLT